MSEKPINWKDQGAHFWSCFLFTLSTLGYGAHIVALWAVTREYYQVKHKMMEAAYESGREDAVTFAAIIRFMWDTDQFIKTDLKFSYAGIFLALCIAIPLKIWVL